MTIIGSWVTIQRDRGETASDRARNKGNAVAACERQADPRAIPQPVMASLSFSRNDCQGPDQKQGGFSAGPPDTWWSDEPMGGTTAVMVTRWLAFPAGDAGSHSTTPCLASFLFAVALVRANDPFC